MPLEMPGTTGGGHSERRLRACSATSELHELVVDRVVNTSGARRLVTNRGEQIPDASIIDRFGRSAPGGQGVAGSNPVSPTKRHTIIRACQVPVSALAGAFEA